jgi:hypothetical protein
MELYLRCHGASCHSPIVYLAIGDYTNYKASDLITLVLVVTFVPSWF